MLHFITVGFLDETAVQQRQVIARAPLSVALLAILRRHADRASSPWVLDGADVVVTASVVKCPWLVGSVRHRRAERFAEEAHRVTGCTIADVEHGRVLSEADFPLDREAGYWARRSR